MKRRCWPHIEADRKRVEEELAEIEADRKRVEEELARKKDEAERSYRTAKGAEQGRTASVAGCL